jgi:hypothetical protein
MATTKHRPRAEVRAGFSTANRLALLEHDMDTQERAHGDLMSKLDKIIAMILGLLVSTTVAAIMWGLQAIG